MRMPGKFSVKGGDLNWNLDGRRSQTYDWRSENSMHRELEVWKF